MCVRQTHTHSVHRSEQLLAPIRISKANKLRLRPRTFWRVVVVFFEVLRANLDWIAYRANGKTWISRIRTLFWPGLTIVVVVRSHFANLLHKQHYHLHLIAYRILQAKFAHTRGRSAARNRMSSSLRSRRCRRRRRRAILRMPSDRAVRRALVMSAFTSK